MVCLLTGNLTLAAPQLALGLPGQTKPCESNTFVSFFQYLHVLFSCAIASVEVFRTILNNGYHNENNEHPDFNKNFSCFGAK